MKRQPQHAILANAQADEWLILRQPPDLAGLREALASVVTDTQRAPEILRQVRAFLSGKCDTPRQTLDLNRLVSEVLVLYDHSPARITARLDPELPPVRGDGTQLRQVIHNLLQNAEDALAGRADARIEVRTERAGERVRLAISDNGGGFAESIMKRVFEPYVTTKPKGTGLGLAIVKKIIDEHHGSVSIENRAADAGRAGAAVTIALPLAA